MNIFILTGAGLSAESGLGTLRDKDGLWNSSKEPEPVYALNALIAVSSELPRTLSPTSRRCQSERCH
jgi:NAD-dependent SIR2 family protein deacetylase